MSVAGIVLATAPRPGLCRKDLEPLLGPDGCARLEAVLVRRAAAWAASLGSVYVAYRPEDARAEIAALAPGATLLAQQGRNAGDRLAHAMGHVLADSGGPAVLVADDVPALGAFHARAAVTDLECGCDVTIGPLHGGGYYLVGMRDPHLELFDLPPEAWGGPHVAAMTLERIARRGLSVGMLRAERELHGPSDVEALLADPAAPADVVAVLRAAIEERA